MSILSRHQRTDPPQAYITNDVPRSPDGMPSYGGGSGGGLPMFQRSVNKERALNSYRAAVFAKEAPLPGSTGPEVPNAVGRQESGPMQPFRPEDANQDVETRVSNGLPPAAPQGRIVPATDRNAVAGRKAFIASHMAAANMEDFGQGANYFDRRDAYNDANSRENEQSRSTAGLRDATSRGIDAETQHVTPQQGAVLGSQARLNNEQANESVATRPSRVKQGEQEVARYGQETPVVVNNQRIAGQAVDRTSRASAMATMAGGSAAMTQANANKTVADATAVQATRPQMVDPEKAANALKTRTETAAGQAKTAYDAQPGFVSRFFNGIGGAGAKPNRSYADIFQEEFANQDKYFGGAPAVPSGKAPPPGALPAGPNDTHPDGATAPMGGKTYVKRAGFWVPME